MSDMLRIIDCFRISPCRLGVESLTRLDALGLLCGP